MEKEKDRTILEFAQPTSRALKQYLHEESKVKKRTLNKKTQERSGGGGQKKGCNGIFTYVAVNAPILFSQLLTRFSPGAHVTYRCYPVYYRKRGSVSYIVREVHSVRERERYRQRERETEVTSPLSR